MNQPFAMPAIPHARKSRQLRLLVPGPLALAPLPRWTALAANSTPADAALSAGAALLALDRIVQHNPPWLGAFSMRQALAAATSAAKFFRCREDAAALRDAVHLARPGDDPGPAGRMHQVFRQISARPLRLDAAILKTIADGLELPLPEQISEYFGTPAKTGNPVVAAAEAAAHVAQSLDRNQSAPAEVFALIVADIVLAQQFGWEKPVPLLVCAFTHSALKASATGRRIRPGDPGWVEACHIACALAAAQAHGQAIEINRRVEALMVAAIKVRAKGSPKALAAILSEDCVSTASLTRHFGSERAARRFLDRLLELGGIRELTSRKTFRLCGL